MKLLFALVLTGYLRNCEGAQEGLKVTLAVFSGAPDPTWLVTTSSPDYETIIRLFNAAKKAGATYLSEKMPAQLGYKGFLVQENNQDLEKASLILGKATIDLQQALLQSIPKGVIPGSLKEQMSVVIGGGKVLPELKNVTKDISKRFSPVYAEAGSIWNYDYNRLTNNCYNYGNNHMTGTFAQPGRGSNHIYNAITAYEILIASILDGLLVIPPGPLGIIPTVPLAQSLTRHLVALFVDPTVGLYNDFHWYRLDSNGLWSHKPGKAHITNKDGCGNLIFDPRLAANTPGGPHYQFVCFMTTDLNLHII